LSLREQIRFQINNYGPTELDAEIFTASNVPEPRFYTLTGSGFVGLLAVAICRRRQKGLISCSFWGL